MDYDAFLLISFGGPERREDVIPFLENVLRGRNVPRERMLEVAEHYYHFDGRSPINDQNRALMAAVREMRDDGIRRALAFVTSAFGSYAGCRQYIENIDAARAAAAEGAPVID